MTKPKEESLIKIDLQWFADEGDVNGSTESGSPAAANAELLNNAFAGTDGQKPAAKPEGNNAAGGKETGSDVKSPKADTPKVETLKLAPWTEQLKQDMRDNPEIAAKFAKFGSIPDFAKAYLELEGKSGGIVLPGKDATAEAVAEFWEKAGRPKTADGYSFAKDKNSDNATYATAAFAANLTETQAAAMLKGLQEIGTLNQKALHDRLQQKQTDTVAALEKEYGSKYKENMEMLKRGLTAAGPNIAKLLSGAGLSAEPEIIKAFIAYGKMTAESGFSKGGGAGASLKSIEDGGSLYNS